MSEQLKRKRKALRTRITKVQNFVQKAVNEENVDIEAIVVRGEQLEEIWKEFDDIQAQLEEQEEEVHDEVRTQVEDQYLNIKTTIRKVTQQKEQATSEKNETQSTTMTREKVSRLPAIKVPEFDGKYEEWRSFYDIFTAIVDENESLTDIEKLFYLKSYIKGDALKLIDSLPASGKNYKTTLQLLHDRYNNAQYIVNAHLKALFHLPSMSKESTTSLWSLINQTKQHLRALETLNLPVAHWDTLMVFMLTQKLDTATRTAWELSRHTTELAQLADLYKFLEKRCDSLESINAEKMLLRPEQKFKPRTTLYSSNEKPREKGCKLCNDNHNLYQCNKFVKMDYKDKIKAIKESNVCFNCLRTGHVGKQCTSRGCFKCGRRHNTLIHPSATHVRHDDLAKATVGSVASSNSTVTLCSTKPTTQVLLSTAQVQVSDNNNRWTTCRILLDNASQSNFVTSRLVKTLGVQTYKKVVPISGIDAKSSHTSEAIQLTISSRLTKYKAQLEFLVLDKITNELPTHYINADLLNIPAELKLADPDFNKPGNIEMLVGGEIFFDILGSARQSLGRQLPFIQSSALGWIVSGKMAIEEPQQSVICLVATQSQKLDQALRRFWEIENPHERTPAFSMEEKQCEELFAKTTYRDQQGRYVVSLPLKQDPKTLGNSYNYAAHRYKKLEERLNKNEHFKRQYTQFMTEYAELGHMQPAIETCDDITYYIPHHAVYKDNGTKIRVVFDASMATSNGISLNKIMMVGPVVQQELFSILLRFRKYKVAFSADIQKMYRQILVNENDQRLQRILWQSDNNGTPQVYQLNTVTYGTASAPYLATKCIQHLSKTDKKYPMAAKRIGTDTYVDDVLTGANTVSEALQLQKEIIALLRSACFELHKWCSNSDEILARVNNTDDQPISPIGAKDTKTLGVLWCARSDTLKFSVSQKTLTGNTKRAILSNISSLFDPLGLLAPVTLTAKLLMQQLWIQKVDWDTELEESIVQRWYDWRNQLNDIENFQVKRHLITIDNPVKFELHGFSDASQIAYGAVLFLRAENEKNETCMRIICAKSRVAPLKQISLPRLELCGAHLLAKLAKRVKEDLEIDFSAVYMWTDSTIVLSWLNELPSKWTTFVANRVSEIQELTSGFIWKHISSKQNPADIISRGTNIHDLKNLKLWWNGPEWILQAKENWPNLINTSKDQLPEQRVKPTHTLTVVSSDELITRYSNINKLQRVTAYCKRFVHNAQQKTNNLTGPLSSTELHNALQTLISIAHKERYTEEIKALKQQRNLSNHSKLRALAPFISEDGILRVGGRLDRASIPYDQMHPIILPEKHPLTTMILTNEHVRLLHAGTQAVLSNIRLKYWPINAKSEIKKIIQNCIKCFRFRAQGQVQFMASLPRERVQPSRPFLHTGIDYGGPILIKTGSRRNAPMQKAYIALFICFCTRAVHLELVTSLSTESFLLAFKRFVSRRGKPLQVKSDNGTNFRGAAHELHDLYQLFTNENSRNQIVESIMNDGVDWKFIPAHAPHHGGLWEAGIKSTKFHLKRTMGNAHMTYEELTTLLYEIEACLNSRPLFPMNNDPLDYNVLTPSHFLIGDVLTAIPIPNLNHISENRLSNWQKIQKLKQQFWKTWTKDYLCHLQQRSKWFKPTDNFKIGMLVLQKEDNLPPLNWAMARIDELHPGSDGRVRVVTIRTSNGNKFKRPITKLCPLPTEIEVALQRGRDVE